MCNARARLGYGVRVGQRRFFGFGQVRMLWLIWLHAAEPQLELCDRWTVKVFSHGDGVA